MCLATALARRAAVRDEAPELLLLVLVFIFDWGGGRCSTKSNDGKKWAL
jgi:hypothetical protein